MNSENNFSSVKTLLSKHTSYPIDKISMRTRIGEDLKIIGDDAAEFLEEFSSAFGVDLSSMKFEDYFPSEAGADMHYYLTTIANIQYENKILGIVRSVESKLWGLFANKKLYKSVTVEDLIIAINAKHW